MNFREHFRDQAAPAIRNDLGEPAQITPSFGGAAVPVQVKFDEPFATQPEVIGGGIESTAPIAEYRTDDYPTPAHGDMVEVDGRTFKVVGIEIDNEFTRLLLEAQT